MDIGKDLQDAYEQGYQDALKELMEYTYGMLTEEKFGLQHKIKSMMVAEQTEPIADTPQPDCKDTSCPHFKNPDYSRCMKCKSQTDCGWK